MATAALLEQPAPRSLADLLADLGDIPPCRVLLRPAPGTATEKDLLRLLDGANKVLCELVDGVLVEKAMGFKEAILAGVILQRMLNYLDLHDLGIVAGADGPIRLRLGLVRLPDVCFISWKRLGGDEVPNDRISKVVPELAVELLSKSNTRREIERKLIEYFQAGVLLVWIIDPDKETAEVHTGPARKKQLAKDGTLDGGKVLPGFKLSLRDLFNRVRRKRKRGS
jgi:Uma2 family endonuclease